MYRIGRGACCDSQCSSSSQFRISKMSSTDNQEWLMSGHDLIFVKIMMVVGLSSLESLNRCRQSSSFIPPGFKEQLRTWARRRHWQINTYPDVYVFGGRGSELLPFPLPVLRLLFLIRLSFIIFKHP